MKFNTEKLKNLIMSVLVICCWLIVAVPSCLAEQEKFPERTVTVGFNEYPGYNEISYDGTRTGYGYEFLRMIAPYANLKYIYANYEKSWSDVMEMLSDGKVDIVTGVRKPVGRDSKYAYNNYGIGTSFALLLTDYMQTDFRPGDVESYKDLHVGMLKNSSVNESFASFAAKNNIEYTARYYDSLEIMHRDLRDGSLNAIVTTDARTLYNFEVVLERFDSAPYYAVTKQSDIDLMKRINYAIAKLDVDQPNWRIQLNQEHFVNLRNNDVKLNFDERVYLTELQKNNQPIKILINPDRAPYASINKNGEFEGIFLDLLRQAAEQCDFKYVLIPTKSTEDYNKATTLGLADIVFDSPSTLYDSEIKGYNVTTSYYDGNFAEIYRKGESKFKTVAVKAGARNMNSVYAAMYGDKEIIEYPSIDACIEAVKNGKADCCYMYIYTAAHYVTADVKGTLTYEPVRGHYTKFRIAVKQGANPLLYSIMNKFANSVTDDTMRSLIARHRVDEEQSFTTYVYRNPVGFVIGALAIIFLIVGGIGYMQWKRRVVEQKKEAEIRRVKDMMDEMTASFPMGIFSYTFDDFKILLSNEEARRLLSTDFTEGTQLTAKTITKNIFPEDIPNVLNQASNLKNIGDQIDYDFRVRLNDGSYADVLATTKLQAFEDGTKYIITGMKDNTEQIRTNRQLLQERATFRDSLLSNARYTFNFDVDDGYIREDIITDEGISLIRMLDLQIPVKFDEFGEKAVKDLGIVFEKKEFENVLSCQALKRFYAAGYKAEAPEYYLSKFDRYARTQCFLYEDLDTGHLMATLFSYDITESVKEEKAKRDLLKESMAATDRANAAKTEFLSQMSHDIRTPMNAIIGMTAIAATHMDDRARLEDCLNKIDTSSKHLLGLINEVLDMSKIEAGKVSLVNEVFDLTQLVDSLLVMTKVQLNAKGHKLITNIDGIEHKKVIGDKDRLQQVFMNLMTNAIKYTPDGGEIKFTIFEKPTGRHSYACYECIFEDNGIGMTPEFLEIIFEPFARAEDSRTSKIQGTGLGMPIAKSIVNMMNGTIEVESTLNVGSKFTVVVYLEIPEEATELEAPVQETTLDNLDELDYSHKRALVVEDNEINAEILGEILSMTGMQIEYAADGKEAVERMQEVENNYYDIIFMDIQMPEMNGYDATRAIRKLPAAYYKEVPIIAMTANAFSEDVQMSSSAGMNEHISKPVDIAKLIECLKKWL